MTTKEITEIILGGLIKKAGGEKYIAEIASNQEIREAIGDGAMKSRDMWRLKKTLLTSIEKYNDFKKAQ